MDGFNFHIDFAAFMDTLPIMGKGMLGIFAVILAIILCVFVLNKLTSKKNKPEPQ